MNIQKIMDSYYNGNLQQMVNQIKEYGLYSFWYDLKRYLEDNINNIQEIYNIFTEITIVYNRITNR